MTRQLPPAETREEALADREMTRFTLELSAADYWLLVCEQERQTAATGKWRSRRAILLEAFHRYIGHDRG